MIYKAEKYLSPLKPFQRTTVEYVFERLYGDANPVDQFLVADEVGLGKTMVARGVIAKTIEEKVAAGKLVNIVYLCSNQAIAQQNIKSLDVSGTTQRPFNTRLTLLPLQLGGEHGLLARNVNFISLTPGTTLDLKSTTGLAEERALIYEILRKSIVKRHKGVRRLFRAGVSDENWKYRMRDIRSRAERGEIDTTISSCFRSEVESHPDLLDRILQSVELAQISEKPNYPDRCGPGQLMAEMRRMLARHSIASLKPDLIILDEFQRFADLLHVHDRDLSPQKAAAAELAQALFKYKNMEEESVKLLLLSATPYRMLTLHGDDLEEGDHYADFLKTMQFLFGGKTGAPKTESLEKELKLFRQALQSFPKDKLSAKEKKDVVQENLQQVIARTERVAASVDGNSFVKEIIIKTKVETDDLREFEAVSKVAKLAEAPGCVEYWKSAPYLLSFMRDYKLPKQLEKLKNESSKDLRKAINAAKPFMVKKENVAEYKQIAPRNGRMRALMEIAFQDELVRDLWIPPARPSFGEPRNATKALVFSDWTMVPDAISALVSHEAGRRMGMNSKKAKRSKRTIDIELMWPMLCPNPALVRTLDPMHLEAIHGPFANFEELFDYARRTLADKLISFRKDCWAAGGSRAIILQYQTLEIPAPDWTSISTEGGGSEDPMLGRLKDVLAENISLPKEPDTITSDQLLDVLVTHALGSPATCALRSLSKIAPELDLNDPQLLEAAMRIALGFRTLFNQPESRALLKEKSPKKYWHKILEYGASHDLPAMLDEYMHMLMESDRLDALTPYARIHFIADRISEVVALRPAEINARSWRAGYKYLKSESVSFTARFAMRFASHSETDEGVKRFGLVQSAFKSPFRPFVLSTTSIGQEGLDFHPYCSRIVHWNLPHNPVEIEQREGRIHRFKNHAVRRNVAFDFGVMVGQKTGDNLWARMFEEAEKKEIIAGRPGDIIPYWMYPGRNEIDRYVLLPPFSREIKRYEALKASLATYRLAFGQPRQDDLLELFRKLPDDTKNELSELQICLRPPERKTCTLQ